jgi:hypothetical protein
MSITAIILTLVIESETPPETLYEYIHQVFPIFLTVYSFLIGLLLTIIYMFLNYIFVKKNRYYINGKRVYNYEYDNEI